MAASRSRRKRERLNPWLRQQVINRDQGYCRYCNIKAKIIEVDHVWPVVRGGQDELNNLVTACRLCNQIKFVSTTWPAELQVKRAPNPEDLYRLGRKVGETKQNFELRQRQEQIRKDEAARKTKAQGSPVVQIQPMRAIQMRKRNHPARKRKAS